ncbi:hypothetical protein [Stagnimonas aquatica]|uniref:hypothetical protein n=1 Tax=Stagnimonas aquatica TaxID=2689987 RepID=UPI0013158B86|nr:hypothetical protein [Stagnimonas aquatica]
MHIYSEIAARYGAKTEEEVDHFFQIEVFKLPAEVQKVIFNELLDSHAVPSKLIARASKPFVRPERSESIPPVGKKLD